MKASIKDIWIESPPTDLDSFSVVVHVVAGPLEAHSGDNFSCTVCSPSWFAENVLRVKRQHPTFEDFEHPPVFGRHYLFANTFDQDAIFAVIERWVGQHEGHDWQDLAQRLSRNLMWEFEDYQEVASVH